MLKVKLDKWDLPNNLRDPHVPGKITNAPSTGVTRNYDWGGGDTKIMHFIHISA